MRFEQKKTKREQFRLEPWEDEALRALAQKHHTTLTAVIRRAIHLLLEHEQWRGNQGSKV